MFTRKFPPPELITGIPAILGRATWRVFPGILAYFGPVIKHANPSLEPLERSPNPATHKRKETVMDVRLAPNKDDTGRTDIQSQDKESGTRQIGRCQRSTAAYITLIFYRWNRAVGRSERELSTRWGDS